MTAVPLTDSSAQRVGAEVADAFRAVLTERLEALLVHGSAVAGGYIDGYSDFDFLVFMHGGLSGVDSRALQARLGAIDRGPFGYLQISEIVDVDEPPEDRRLLIDGGYASLVGDYPTGWPLHDDGSLRLRGDEVFAGLPGVLERAYRHWAAANGPRRTLEVRYYMTSLKPAVRAHLVDLGEDVLEVWTAPYGELARRWQAREPESGGRFERLVASLPGVASDEAALGDELLALLEMLCEAHA
jgi:hypothetical protein